MLFCDLVGSTALAARLDPEDLGQVIRAYQAMLRRSRESAGTATSRGTWATGCSPISATPGPRGRRRAGGAGGAGAGYGGGRLLSLAGRWGRARGSQRLAARVGIATGLVMVGELVGEGAAQEEAVVGETPNLAARLQALAEPGSVVIAASTRRLLGGLFELADLGPRRLKGFAEPLPAFRVVGEGHAEGRFEALRGQQRDAARRPRA